MKQPIKRIWMKKNTNLYTYEHNDDGSVRTTHQYINGKVDLKQTDESLTDANGNNKMEDTYKYKDKNGHVEVEHTSYTNGTTEKYHYNNE